MKIKHIVVKKKTYAFVWFALFVFALFTTIFIILVNHARWDNLPLNFITKFITKLLIVVVVLFVVTREENNHLFQPTEYEGIEHISYDGVVTKKTKKEKTFIII